MSPQVESFVAIAPSLRAARSLRDLWTSERLNLPVHGATKRLVQRNGIHIAKHRTDTRSVRPKIISSVDWRLQAIRQLVPRHCAHFASKAHALPNLFQLGLYSSEMPGRVVDDAVLAEAVTPSVVPESLLRVRDLVYMNWHALYDRCPITGQSHCSFSHPLSGMTLCRCDIHVGFSIEAPSKRDGASASGISHPAGSAPGLVGQRRTKDA